MEITQYGLQYAFENVRSQIKTSALQEGYSPQQADDMAQNAILTNTFLRLEQPLSALKQVIQFPIIEPDSGAVFPCEIRLPRQDAFFCFAMTLYIALTTGDTDTTFILQTYPNPKIFTNGGAGFAAGQAPYYTLYNGFLSVNINKEVILPACDLGGFLYVPQTQLPATPAGVTTQFDPNVVQLFEPSVNFIGTKNTQIYLNMRANIPSANVDANTRIIIKAYGIQAQNITVMS